MAEPSPAPEAENAEASVRATMRDRFEANDRAWEHWDEEDEELLIALVQQGHDWPEIAGQLGRTDGAVRTRAKRLAFAAHFGREIPDKATQPGPRPWTGEEVRQLVELIGTAESWEQIGTALNRGGRSCRTKAENVALELFAKQ